MRGMLFEVGDYPNGTSALPRAGWRGSLLADLDFDRLGLAVLELQADLDRPRRPASSWSRPMHMMCRPPGSRRHRAVGRDGDSRLHSAHRHHAVLVHRGHVEFDSPTRFSGGGDQRGVGIGARCRGACRTPLLLPWPATVVPTPRRPRSIHPPPQAASVRGSATIQGRVLVNMVVPLPVEICRRDLPVGSCQSSRYSKSAAMSSALTPKGSSSFRCPCGSMTIKVAVWSTR